MGTPFAPVSSPVQAPLPVGLAERVDPSVAEVGDEQVAAEAAERARRERDSPRLVQARRAADLRDELPVEVELVDVAAGRRVVPVHRRAPHVRHEDVPTDRVDAERRVPGRNAAVDERAATFHTAPAIVVDVDPSVVEVGRVDPLAGDREPAEDGGFPRLVDDDERLL